MRSIAAIGGEINPYGSVECVAGGFGLLGWVEDEASALAEEFEWVVVDDAADGGFGVAAAAHFEDEIGYGRRFGGAPIASGVD